MNHRLSIILFCILIGQDLHAQMDTGLYFTVNQSPSDCDKKLSLRYSGDIYCLEQEPIIKSKEFHEISEIYESANEFRNLDILLTPIGLKKLNIINSEFSQMELAIVVRGKLIGTIFFSKGSNIDKITISEDPNAHQLNWIYRELKRVILKNNSSK